MEQAIQRGRLLREILKQDRLSPMPVNFQMAWLVAFNENLFDEQHPESVPAILDELAEAVQHTSLELDSPREEWHDAVSRWITKSKTANTA